MLVETPLEVVSKRDYLKISESFREAISDLSI